MSESPSLVWGSTSLVRDETSGLDWWIEASADGTNWGNPEAVVTQIKSHLQDGSLAQVTSDDNRQATIRVQVCAYDYEGLAQGEAALVAEANVPGYSTLTWAPNRFLAKPTVFDVVYATIAFDFDDLSEVKRGEGTLLQRKYALTLECLPFGHDETETTVYGEETGAGADDPGAPIEKSINNGSSASGWTRLNSSAASSNGSQVYISPYSSGGQIYTVIARTQALAYADGPYVFWDWAQAGTDGMSPTMGVVRSGGSTFYLSPVLTVAGNPGFTRSYFRIPDDQFPVASVRFGYMNSYDGTPDPNLYVDQLTQSSAIPGAGAGGSRRQKTTTVKVGGSARTPARIELTCPSVLGPTTLIYTRQAGSSFQPPLRPWANTPDLPGGDFSGGLSTNLGAKIPAASLLPGTYNLVANVAGSGTLRYTVTMIRPAGSESYGDATGADETEAAGEVAVFGGVVDLGLFTLPPFGVDSGSKYRVQVTLNGIGGVQIDEAWLFDVDRGALSIIHSNGLRTVEIRTPDINLPEPSYWGTYNLSGSNPGGEGGERVRIDYRVLASEHYFEAGLVDIFTACSNVSSSVKASFYRRHHTHATDVDA